MNSQQIADLEKEAELNDGHCGTCHQTIKIYRYKVNKTHATFLKAMAAAVRDTGVNDVDIATIGIAYSVRSQCSKMRQHGLIARVKSAQGTQLARRWLITHKGWDFLNGREIPQRVVVYNNQVLGHDGRNVTMTQVLGGLFKQGEPVYTETPVSEPEARTYEEVRPPKKQMEVKLRYVGRGDYPSLYRTGEVHELVLDGLQVGQPVSILKPIKKVYRDIAAFQKEWRAI